MQELRMIVAEELPDKENLSLEELAVTNSYELIAIFNILERRGLITKTEFLEEVKRLHKTVKKLDDTDPYVVRG